MQPLDRLIRPRSIAVIGGGGWCANVIRESRRIGFAGPIHPVHPTRPEIGGLATVPDIAALPAPPDAVFVGVNRAATIEVVRGLAAIGAGGAVCFASGFREAAAELGDAADLQQALIAAAGTMRILGPNCYGFLNYLDGAALWPDQHGGEAVSRGVAIVTQSSNIAINLTMQRRGLPLAYMVTAGNQAQTGLSEIGAALLADPRVTALGLHVEGIDDLRGLEALARRARDLGKPVVALKVGRSDQARLATVSHTASLAGSDAGARALFDRLGIGTVASLSGLLETLKLLHVAGPLRSNRIASMSCSGGEASLVADAAQGSGIEFPALTDPQRGALRAALGPKVALANPLDYNTYVWGDGAAMTAVFSAMMVPSLAMGCVVLDFPRPDRCGSDDWGLVLEAAQQTGAACGVPMAILGTLAENIPEPVAQDIIGRGMVPLCGLDEAVQAMAVAAWLGETGAATAPLLLPRPPLRLRSLTEAASKAALAAHGLRVPRSGRAGSPQAAAARAVEIGFPVALKGEGIAHKSEAGAVVLRLHDAEQVAQAAQAMTCESFLVEQMVSEPGIELLVGVVLDPAHGYVLTLAAGGVWTEMLRDRTSLLLPVDGSAIRAALSRLRIAPLLAGYRGAPPVDLGAVVGAVLAVQDYVTAEAGRIAEVEIYPLICSPGGAVAVDALIRTGEIDDR